MNNNFDQLAEAFATRYFDERYESDEDLETQIRTFLANRGIDEAWMDEAVEVVTELVESM